MAGDGVEPPLAPRVAAAESNRPGSEAATGGNVDGAGTGACGSERNAVERDSGAGMAGGDGTELPLPGSDDSAFPPRGSGLADGCDAVCPGTASTPGRSFARALSMLGAGSLASTSGLSLHAPVPRAMSAGTTTATRMPITATTVQERSPSDFRSAAGSFNRPECIGTPRLE